MYLRYNFALLYIYDVYVCCLPDSFNLFLSSFPIDRINSELVVDSVYQSRSIFWRCLTLIDKCKEILTLLRQMDYISAEHFLIAIFSCLWPPALCINLLHAKIWNKATILHVELLYFSLVNRKEHFLFINKDESFRSLKSFDVLIFRCHRIVEF